MLKKKYQTTESKTKQLIESYIEALRADVQQSINSIHIPDEYNDEKLQAEVESINQFLEKVAQIADIQQLEVEIEKLSQNIDSVETPDIKPLELAVVELAKIIDEIEVPSVDDLVSEDRLQDRMRTLKNSIMVEVKRSLDKLPSGVSAAIKRSKITDLIITGTRESILVTAPKNSTLAYATDTKQYYIYNTKWFAISNITGVPNERTSTQINAGALQSSSETSGYSSKYISGKGISNSFLGNFDDANYTIKNGAIRYNATSKQIQVYIDEWKALRALSPSEVENVTVYSALKQKDGKGRFMVQHGFINAGALASNYLIDGGSF